MSTPENRYRRQTPLQTHDVWEVGDVEEITEEVQRVMKSMGLSTDEVKKALSPKEKRRGS